MTVKETNYWNEEIFTEKNLCVYFDMDSKEDKKTFISNIVADKIGTTVSVKRFDEDEKVLISMKNEEVFSYVNTKFIRKKMIPRNRI